MAAKIGKAAVVVEPRRLLQLVEHAREALRREPCIPEDGQTDPVRLALHVAREIELVLHRHRLATDHEGVRRIRALAGGQDSKDHGAKHPGRLRVLLGHQAGDMALGDVAEFMGHDTDQPQMQSQVTAGQCEGIHGAITAEHDLPGETLVEFGRDLAALARCRQQALPDGIHVFGQHRVVQVVGVPVDLSRDTVAEPTLGAGAEFAAIPQGGKLAPGRTGACRGARRSVALRRHGRGRSAGERGSQHDGVPTRPALWVGEQMAGDSQAGS